VIRAAALRVDKIIKVIGEREPDHLTLMSVDVHFACASIALSGLEVIAVDVRADVWLIKVSTFSPLTLTVSLADVQLLTRVDARVSVGESWSARAIREMES
jgi:hypothetical protein